MGDTEDTAMVDTVAREKLKLNQKLKLITEVLDTDTVPDTDSDLTDMVDTVPDTDSAMPDTVSDTAMVDTVARDPLMLTMDVDTVMEVTVMEVTAVDTDTDTESKHFPPQTNQRNHSIQNYAILITAK